MLRIARLHRTVTAFFAVAVLLFSQLALATYVCPGAPAVEAMAAMAAAGVPCEGMDAVQPVLCHQYGMSAAQSFEAVKVPTPSLPAVVQVWVLPAVLPLAGDPDLPGQEGAEPRPPPDPLFLATLRLRV